MGEYNFSKKQCLKALWAIGFYEKTDSHRRSPHMKFSAPRNLPTGGVNGAARPFIMIPHCSEQKFHLQKAIVKELRRLGGEELVKQFLANL